MKTKDSKIISDNLSKYDYTVSKDSENDFVELHRWQNDEGFIVMFNNKTIELSDGQLDAIIHLNNCLKYV